MQGLAGFQRWSVWINSGVTGGRNGGENPVNSLKSRGSEVHLRGSPRGYFPLFEPIWLAPKIVNCLITKRDCRSYFLFLWYGVLLTRRWRTITPVAHASPATQIKDKTSEVKKTWQSEDRLETAWCASGRTVQSTSPPRPEPWVVQHHRPRHPHHSAPCVKVRGRPPACGWVRSADSCGLTSMPGKEP